MVTRGFFKNLNIKKQLLILVSVAESDGEKTRKVGEGLMLHGVYPPVFDGSESDGNEVMHVFVDIQVDVERAECLPKVKTGERAKSKAETKDTKSLLTSRLHKDSSCRNLPEIRGATER